MKKRVLTLLVIVAALTFGLATTVSAQNDNPTVCFNLSQEDCDVLSAAVANSSANLTSFNADFTVDFAESNQVFVVGVNDAAVTLEGEASLATDAAAAMADPLQGTSLSLEYGASGNLGPYGVTGGQTIVFAGGTSYWTDAASGQWVGISANDALMLGLGAVSVGMGSMESIPGMDMLGMFLDPSMLEGAAPMLLGMVSPQALISDPAGALSGLGLGMLPPVFYASMERVADMEMDGQTMNGFALTANLDAALVASSMGDMGGMIPAEVWDDLDVTATITRWYGADDQLQHGTQLSLDVTIGSTARTFFVSLIAPNAVPADAMLAPGAFSIDVDAPFTGLNEMIDITAPSGAAMITLESIMGAMGSMTGGQ